MVWTNPPEPSEALAVFEQMGAKLWADGVRVELAPVEGHTSGSGGGAAVQRVAQLAALGMTNAKPRPRCSSARKTVEANLSRIYRKLGIHTRTELGKLIAQPKS